MRALIRQGVLLLCMMLTGLASINAQEAGLVSCVPATGMQGQQVDVVIKGRFTNFQQQTVTVDFGPDIQVDRLEIRDFESLVARINISQNASIGPVEVKVRAGNAVYILPNGFSILNNSGQLSAVLEVFPMQTVRMSDFEVTRITASPIIFNVIIYNDNKIRDLNVRLTLKGDRYGLVGFSKKTMKNIQPGSILRFSNREFDNYELNSRNNSLMQLIAKTNILPADAYDYILELFDDRGVKVGGAEASQVIVNLATRPELIMPGALFGQQLTIISTPNPQFQWFSQAAKYDFALFPVLPNQFSQEEVLLNRPIYAKEGLVTSSLVYPSSAEILIDGQTYAWQVKAKYTTSKGEDVLLSDVYWFKFSKNLNQDIVTEVIRINPAYAEVQPGGKIQFSLEALANNGSRKLDLNGRDRNLVQLRLVPESKGVIDPSGIFTAGNNPGPIALVAEFAGQTEYATILIKGSSSTQPNNDNGVLDKLLGLPTSNAKSNGQQTSGTEADTTIQASNGSGTARGKTTTATKPTLQRNAPPANGESNPATDTTTIQAANGAGTRSAIPSTRNKPGLRHETQPGPGINGATGNGQQPSGVGKDTTIQEGNGAGTRSAIPSTRNKPGLRREGAPTPDKAATIVTNQVQGNTDKDSIGMGKQGEPTKPKSGTKLKPKKPNKVKKLKINSGS